MRQSLRPTQHCLAQLSAWRIKHLMRPLKGNRTRFRRSLWFRNCLEFADGRVINRVSLVAHLHNGISLVPRSFISPAEFLPIHSSFLLLHHSYNRSWSVPVRSVRLQAVRGVRVSVAAHNPVSGGAQRTARWVKYNRSQKPHGARTGSRQSTGAAGYRR